MSAAVVDLHIIELDVSTERLRVCRGLLNEQEIARADRFVRARHRDRWTVSRAYLRTALGEFCNVSADRIVFANGDNGKPLLAAPQRDQSVHFNLTHSHTLALLAVTRVAPIGVDVEYMRKVRDADAIVGRFFSAAEQANYRQVAIEDRQRAFYLGWTRKEALIKATGEGLSADLGSFDVALAPDAPARVLAIGGSRARASRWQLLHLQPRPEYVGAIALHTTAPVELRTIDLAA